MKVLVVGGNGFIGAHLVNALQLRGDEVSVLDRLPPRSGTKRVGVLYVQGDFHDTAVLGQLLPGVDQVFHLASCTVPSTAEADPVLDVQGNLLGTHALLAAMRDHHVRRLCYFSSGGTVYGNPDQVPVPETHPLRPISSYGIVKTSIEHYLSMFQRQGWLQPVIVRPSNPYGPGQAMGGIQGAVAVFLGKALLQQPVRIWGDGEIVRDYIYIDDLARLALAATDSPHTGAFNAGSGVGTSLNELCRIIRRVTGTPLKVDYEPSRTFDVKEIVLDVGRASRELGWSPQVTTEAGVALMWSSIAGERRSTA